MSFTRIVPAQRTWHQAIDAKLAALTRRQSEAMTGAGSGDPFELAEQIDTWLELRAAKGPDEIYTPGMGL